MTRFWRDGFWRTSINGNTHWVDGHWVERDTWERSSSTSYFMHDFEYPGIRDAQSNRALSAAQTWSIHEGFRATFVNPNARCPVCGAQVFFYQNEYGSRVFFDQLGPPWPKHPCTDNQPGVASRSNAEGRNINSAQLTKITIGVHPRVVEHPMPELIEVEPIWKHGPMSPEWECMLIIRRSARDGRIRLVARLYQKVDAKRVRFSVSESVNFPEVDQVFFLNKDRASYFDFALFSPREIEIEREVKTYRPGGRSAKKRQRRKLKRQKARKKQRA